MGLFGIASSAGGTRNDGVYNMHSGKLLGIASSRWAGLAMTV